MVKHSPFRTDSQWQGMQISKNTGFLLLTFRAEPSIKAPFVEYWFNQFTAFNRNHGEEAVLAPQFNVFSQPRKLLVATLPLFKIQTLSFANREQCNPMCLLPWIVLCLRCYNWNRTSCDLVAAAPQAPRGWTTTWRRAALPGTDRTAHPWPLWDGHGGSQAPWL